MGSGMDYIYQDIPGLFKLMKNKMPSAKKVYFNFFHRLLFKVLTQRDEAQNK